ncbi:MAG: hypothetical protein JO099_19360 [Acidobacteriia bacterium]|nr:hypothetical protein [Terriglobia bacterium]
MLQIFRISSFITIGLLALRAWGAPGPARIFVEPFGEKPGASGLRTELVRLLEKEPHITVADDATKADFIVSGTGETYIKGYLGTNPRVRYLNSEAQPVYGGYLSVELKNPEHETVWSYLVTPRRFGPEDINRNLAGQIVNRLAQEIAFERKAAKP